LRQLLIDYLIHITCDVNEIRGNLLKYEFQEGHGPGWSNVGTQEYERNYCDRGCSVCLKRVLMTYFDTEGTGTTVVMTLQSVAVFEDLISQLICSLELSATWGAHVISIAHRM
jgi:hypothetical protein